MSIEERLANLVAAGALKPAAREPATVRQHIADAKAMLADAGLVQTPRSRFVLAYEGLHALSMAFLNERGLRTDGEGHRSVSLQVAVGELVAHTGMQGVAQAIIRIHNVRNDVTYYRPIPPVTEALANATVKLLRAALAGVALVMHPVEDTSVLPRPHGT